MMPFFFVFLRYKMQRSRHHSRLYKQMDKVTEHLIEGCRRETGLATEVVQTIRTAIVYSLLAYRWQLIRGGRSHAGLVPQDLHTLGPIS